MTQTRAIDGKSATMLTYFVIGLVIGLLIGGNVGLILIAMMIAGRRGETRRDG